MSIVITKEIEAAYKVFLDAPIDAHADGKPILRKNTWPYNSFYTGLIDFAAGWQANAARGEPTDEMIDAGARAIAKETQGFGSAERLMHYSSPAVERENIARARACLRAALAPIPGEPK